jgi:hypothetical protein
LRLIGPVPQPDTVACTDSTRQAVLWLPSIRPGRYRLALNRVGFEGRVVLIDVAPHQTDTVTVGLLATTGDIENRVATSRPAPRCAAQARER